MTMSGAGRPLRSTEVSGVRLDEQLDGAHVRAGLADGAEQRRHAVDVAQLEVGLVREQRLDDLGGVGAQHGADGAVKRGLATHIVLEIDVDAELDHGERLFLEAPATGDIEHFAIVRHERRGGASSRLLGGLLGGRLERLEARLDAILGGSECVLELGRARHRHLELDGVLSDQHSGESAKVAAEQHDAARGAKHNDEMVLHTTVGIGRKHTIQLASRRRAHTVGAGHLGREHCFDVGSLKLGGEEGARVLEKLARTHVPKRRLPRI